MKNKLKYVIVFYLLWALAGPLYAQKSYDQLVFPKLKDITLPPIVEKALPNGMQLYLIEDHNFPIISLTAIVRTGSITDIPDKIGLADLTAEVMRTGGTKTVPGDTLDVKLERIAASIGISMDQTSASASFTCLKENVDDVLALFSDVIKNPTFPEDKIELARIQARTSISRRNDDIGIIAQREFLKIIYGSVSPYARTVEYQTVDAVTRQDMIAFHQKFFIPNGMIVGVIGDFDATAMTKKLSDAFGNMKQRPAEKITVPPVNYDFKSGIFVVDKKDAVQTNIILGHVGGISNNPDYFALIVLNTILGEGFTSRLFTRVRTQEGLSYDVFGEYGFDYDHPGVFSAGCETKSESTVKAIQIITSEIERLTKEKVSPEELRIAKEGFLNRFVFHFNTKEEILGRLITYKYYGYPDDFLLRTKGKIEQVTADDVLRVAKKYLRPDKMKILVVGNADTFKKSLLTLGSLTTVDITIPEPGAVPVLPATQQSLDKGRDFFNKMVDAVGGKTNILTVKNKVYSATVTIASQQGELSGSVVATILYPDKINMKISIQGQTIEQVVNGFRGQVSVGGSSKTMLASEVNEVRSNLLRDPIWLVQNADALTLQFIEEAIINNIKVANITVSSGDGRMVTLLIDEKTYLPNRFLYQTKSEAGPRSEETILSDFREINGVQFPFRQFITSSGKLVQETIVTEMKINQTLNQELFIIK